MTDLLQNMTEKAGFFNWLFINGGVTIAAFVLITIVLRIYYLKIDRHRDEKTPEEIGHAFAYEPDYFFNSVMEIIVCNTCISGMLCVYDSLKPVIDLISDYSSLVLLVLILIAIGANRIVDAVWLDKEWSSNAKYSKNTLRLVSSITVTIMWILLSVVFGSAKYVSVMVIMLGLVLGRFIYFDSSIGSLKKELIGILKCWKSAAVAILLLILLFWTGLHFEIIQEENVVATVFFAHCFYLMVTKTLKRVLKDLVEL